MLIVKCKAIIFTTNFNTKYPKVQKKQYLGLLMNILEKYGTGLLHLFFPKICLVCERSLLALEKTVCYRCINSLEKGRYTNFRDNEIIHIFEGSVFVKYATAGFRYHKGGLLQELIFQLKYHHHKEIGVILGREMGYQLENTEFSTIDAIIPVPLHPRKLRKRGYNQAEWIAKGIAEALDKDVQTDWLKRVVNTTSQTKKNRAERFTNMEEVFVVNKNINFANKHLLLVDDVVTTGSTLSGCAEALKKSADNVQISIACLAKAD